MTQESLLKPPYVIGMPTETVYGLAARVDCPEGISAIFRLKERPFFDPLIVHVETKDQVLKVARSFGKIARILADKFWPGPLTLVLPKRPDLNPMITSGLDTVGVRMPRHPLALSLIRAEGPLAAPSANKFGRTSPTTAAHVAEEFGAQVPVIDGGPCEVGLESTVLSITEDNDRAELRILRPGAVTESNLRQALAEVGVENFFFASSPMRASSPGSMKHHYMPAIPLILVRQPQMPMAECLPVIEQRLHELPDAVEGVKLIKPEQVRVGVELKLPENPALAARLFYSELRNLAASRSDVILFFEKKIHRDEDWRALYDRLTKAASLIVE